MNEDATTTSKQSTGNSLKDVMTGRFLVGPLVVKNWRFIAYLSLLCLIMIASSHNAERKVHLISRLRAEMKELNSEYIDTRSRLMIQSMEYKVIERGEAIGLLRSATPPIKIKNKEQ